MWQEGVSNAGAGEEETSQKIQKSIQAPHSEIQNVESKRERQIQRVERKSKGPEADGEHPGAKSDSETLNNQIIKDQS